MYVPGIVAPSTATMAMKRRGLSLARWIPSERKLAACSHHARRPSRHGREILPKPGRPLTTGVGRLHSQWGPQAARFRHGCCPSARSRRGGRAQARSSPAATTSWRAQPRACVPLVPEASDSWHRRTLGSPWSPIYQRFFQALKLLRNRAHLRVPPPHLRSHGSSHQWLSHLGAA